MPASLIRSVLLLGSSLAGWAPLHAAAPVAADAAAAVAADAAGADGDDRETVTVTGARPANIGSAGTKSATPLLETPQSISVLTAGDLSALGLQNLNQALRYVAGVTPEQRGASAEVYDQFKLRGFDAPVFLDGLIYTSQNDATGYAAAQADVSRLDRIEIVKGSSSALYGKSGPGGIVNQESKLPLDRDFYGAVAGSYGTFDLYRVDGDVGGRLSDNALWRVYGSVNGAHGQQQYGVRRRQTLSGAITLGAHSRTSLTLLAAYSHDPRNGNYGVFPTYGTFLPDPAGKISRNFYGGEPNDFFYREQAGITYILRHDFGGDWAFRASGRYQYVRSRLGIVYTNGTPISDTLFARSSYSTREQNNNWVYDNQLTGKLVTGPLTHQLLFGTDRQVLHFNELSAFGGGTPIDPFDPVYGTMPTPQTPAAVPANFGVTLMKTQQRQQSVYGQDQISWGGLRLALTGRQDWARQASTGNEVQHNSKFTYRLGALYKTDFGLAPYLSYSTSFLPQAAVLLSGALASPSLGKQIEGGVKYQVPNTPILITAAYFHIEQTNVLTTDPLTFRAQQSGKVQSNGFELEARAPLPHGFNATVAFSRQRVKVLEDASDPRNVNKGLLGVGRGNLSANLEWTGRSGPLEGLTIGGGVRHVDKVYAGIYFDGVARNTPGYTLFDALVRYDLGKISPRLARFDVAVNATNLTNKSYFTSCYATYGWCWYGNRRTVQGTIGYRW
jgi:iron complex outermembrane receptor protein